MLFYETPFIFGYLIFISLYFLISQKRRNLLILFTSYYFYGQWNYTFLILLIFSTVLDYFCGIKIPQSKKRSVYLSLSLLGNLGILGYYKYSNFFLGSFYELFPGMGDGSKKIVDVILPAGISFYTFQTLSYTIDIYNNKLKPEKNFIDFASFVTFFPQLVAGPIERASDLLSQLKEKHTFSTTSFFIGLRLFIFGAFKKLVIADNLSAIVDPTFASPEKFDTLSLLFSAYAFSWQIYCDFSGYTDMARGLAKTIGVDLSINFNLPYFSTSIKDFWRKWHITLSTWFRDYVYIPLGGKKNNKLLTSKNLFLTFILSGLWHGAGWNFLIWGAYNAFILILGEFSGKSPFFQRIPKYIKIFFTYHTIVFGWIIFRAENFEKTVQYLKGIFFNFPKIVICGSTWSDVILHIYKSLPESSLHYLFICSLFITPLLGYQFFQYRNRMDIDFKIPILVRGLFYSLIIFCLFLFQVPNAKQFIYFQF